MSFGKADGFVVAGRGFHGNQFALSNRDLNANTSMNFWQPWNIIFSMGFALGAWIRLGFAHRTRREVKTVRRVDSLEKLRLIGIIVAILFLPSFYLFTPLLDFANYRLPPLVPWFGTVILVASLWLFWCAHSNLGTSWSESVELRRDHELVIHGVCRPVRHPMNSAIGLWRLAQGMLLQNWLAGGGGCAGICSPVFYLHVDGMSLAD